MELWIRSQDKKALREVHDLNIDRSNGQYNICTYTGISNIILGKYETKERALEVLDEVQRLVTDLQYLSYGLENDKFCSYRPNVYEMPKE